MQHIRIRDISILVSFCVRVCANSGSFRSEIVVSDGNPFSCSNMSEFNIFLCCRLPFFVFYPYIYDLKIETFRIPTLHRNNRKIESLGKYDLLLQIVIPSTFVCL